MARSTMGTSLPWIVLKFGGTSVSSEPNWRHICEIVQQRRSNGVRVLIVHSALSGVTDRLEKLLESALRGEHLEPLAALRQRHAELALSLGIAPQVEKALEPWFNELAHLIDSIALIREVTEKARARVMAMGELLATEIGACYLRSQGVEAAWLDARSVLRAEQREAASIKASYLSATCDFAPSAEASAKVAAAGDVVITQGFIASDAAGDTVLLGRGGSDTSGAYFAALLSAQQLEIWTDVPGMFSANPRSMPTARQLLELTYDEAQEIATAGAKVLHPRCLLPVRQYGIPLFVYATQVPQLRGTRITSTPGSDAAQVKAICVKKGITLVSLESPGMWHQVGFLADVFQIFKKHGLSVDLVSTSETNVTVSLDPQANALDNAVLAQLQADLKPLCRTDLIGPCASVSVVGRNIRSILHQLGGALELFEEQRIHLVSQAANDLNLTFVVDENQGDRLVEGLHELLIRPVRDDAVIGPTWERLFGSGRRLSETNAEPWWQVRRSALLELMRARDCAYVYDVATVLQRCASLQSMKALSRVSYAMKANSSPELLRVIHSSGLKIECVSIGEVERAFEAIPELRAEEVLFTPNFAPREEYAAALDRGVHVTLDNLHPLEHWPELFKGRRVFVRIDPGSGRGHHQHVRTGGIHSKFGVAQEDASRFAAAAKLAGATVVGLHAHAGSGVHDIDNWVRTTRLLLSLRDIFPQVRVIDIGGGIGVPDRHGGPAFDIAGLDAALRSIDSTKAGVELWMEPGRYVVAEAGVLLAKVTQTKTKGAAGYVGVATGMNSLIRPALYGAHHDIVNLSRLAEATDGIFDVVGPICETGDVLGHDRALPASTGEGDVLLIATAGAYGASMASNYNLRSAAEELLLR